MKSEELKWISNAWQNPIVSVRGGNHPAEFLGRFAKEEYEDLPFKFLDEFERVASGNCLHVYRWGITPVMRLVAPGVVMQEVASGWWGWSVRVDSNGKVIAQRVGPGLKNNPGIQHETGSVHTWIGGSDGLEVLNLTVPQWNKDMEERIIMGSKNDDLPREFWKQIEEFAMRPLTSYKDLIE